MTIHTSPSSLNLAVDTCRLANGLEVVVVPDRRAPVVTHMVWYKNGAADDPIGKSGIAHFLEHLMFKGTKAWPAGDFSKIVAGFGGQENAFTSFDYTAYFQRVPKAHLGDMMGYEADRMMGLSFDEDVVAPERNVVLEERRMRVDADPSAQLGEEFMGALFLHHPYGLPVIGWEHEIEGLTRDDAFNYYRRFYTPSNAILVVAGDTDIATVTKLAEDHYGKVAGFAEGPVRLRPREPLGRAARRVALADPRVQQPAFRRGWVTPSYPSAQRDGLGDEAFALDLATAILGDGPTSRLYRAVVMEAEVAAHLQVYYWGSLMDAGLVQVAASPRPGIALETVEATLDRALLEFLDSGPTEAELLRARTRLVADTIYSRDSQSSLAQMFGASLAVGESVADVLAWPARLESVGAEAVLAAARRYLQPGRAVTGLLTPAG
jgi:zinc protease